MEYAKRRSSLAKEIDGDCLILHGASMATRSHDTEYPFRQNSHLQYLTGHPEPQTVLVLTTRPEPKSYLFVPAKDPQMELWTGKKLGTEKSKALAQVDECHELGELQKKLPDLIKGHHNLYLDMNLENQVMEMHRLLKQHSNRRKIKDRYPQGLLDINSLVGKLRLVKDKDEINLMKKAAQISCLAHKAAMAYAREGRFEYQVQALIEFIFKSSGATFPAYESIVAGGNNANVLHYIENKDALNSSEYLLIDAGCEFQSYASDITRTFPISGKFEGAGKDIYQIVLNAQKKTIEEAKEGKTLKKLHDVSSRHLIQGLIDLKVLSGDVEQNLKNEEFRKYFPHGTSHWLGIDVHDNTPYLTNDLEDITFSTGMTFTVEPGLYFPAEDETIPKALRGIGVRIEDDILITTNGHENLTANAPKEIKDIEQACSLALSDIGEIKQFLS